MTHILIVCTNQPIAATIARLIDKVESWHAAVALSLNEALEHCYAKTFDVILIGSGISQEHEDVLKLHIE
ncbi:response regulator, partial [Pedobacter sp.]